MQISPEEIQKLNNGFEENSELPSKGLFLGGAKYMVVQGDPGIVVRGKKVRVITPINVTPKFIIQFIWF